MNEALLLTIAGAAALFMATLAKAECSSDLRAAIRTTLVVFLGWGVACVHFGFKSWSDWTWQAHGMLALSALAVILAWMLHFRATRTKTVSRVATMDRVNVGLAILFAALFLLQQMSPQSALVGVVLVGSALVLASGLR